MNHLSQRDVDGALSVLAEADASSPSRPFAPELVGLLGNLVGAESESYYCEFDFETHAVCHIAEHLAVECPDDIRAAFLSLCRFYPLRDKLVGNATEALTLSDFQSPREQRRNPCIQEGLRPLGIQHELRIFLPAPTSSSRSFTFSRGPGRDF